MLVRPENFEEFFEALVPMLKMLCELILLAATGGGASGGGVPGSFMLEAVCVDGCRVGVALVAATMLSRRARFTKRSCSSTRFFSREATNSRTSSARCSVRSRHSLERSSMF